MRTVGLHAPIIPLASWMQDSGYNSPMPGYLIANVKNVHDPERFAEYSSQTPALSASHGGRYLVRGGEVDPVEVSGPIGRVVVIEFPTFDAARRTTTATNTGG